MLLFLFNAIALVLHFDGSLRVPHDPNPQIVPHSTSCQFLPPLASCAGALLLDDNFDDDGEVEEEIDDDDHKHSKERKKIISMKGKIIDDDVILTSANVEYEGLLLALKLLFNFLDRQNKTSSVYTNSNKVVTVRGDCKTVIDQMNDVSKPRKQRDYYDRSIYLVENIITNFNITITFEHVLRDQNQLCDSICHDVIQKHQNEFIGTLDGVIEDIISKEPMKLPSSKKKRLNYKGTHFSNFINDLSNWDSNSRSRIPLSIRPYWLCKIALHAEQIGDYVAMRLIGDALIEESKQWKKQGLLHENKSFVLQMEDLGRCMIVYSLEKMELHKEALKLASKPRNEDGTASLHDRIRSFQSKLL